jgi:hypothetical protein
VIFTLPLPTGLARWEVRSYAYRTAAAAKKAWADTAAALKPLEDVSASFWRTRRLGYPNTHYLVLVADEGSISDEWLKVGHGIEVDLPRHELEVFIERRLASILNEALSGRVRDGKAHQEAHYGERGAYMRRGGIVEPRIGRDQ